MIGDAIGFLVLAGLAFFFGRYTQGNSLAWIWEQIHAGWKRIGR